MAVVRVRRSTLRSARPGGQRVGIGFVVEQDQHAVGVGEVPLVLLHARARQRSAELGRQRRRQQLGQVEVGQLGHDARELVHVLAAGSEPSTCEHVQQAAAGVANGGDDSLQAAPAVVFDDDAGVRRDVGAQVGVDRVWGRRRSPESRRRRDVEPAGGSRRGTRSRTLPTAPDAVVG